MTFHPLMIKLVAVALDDLPPHPTVVELGNQTFDPDAGILPTVIRYLETKSRRFDREALESLMKTPADELGRRTADYYRALGFVGYDAIDVNAKYGSLMMDLNVDLHAEYGFDKRYDLVTNNGTGEHIFNQYAVFKNMHDLTEVGGIMLHVLPFYNWLNHGFYNFNPIVFSDLAAANGYRILRLSIANNLGPEIEARIEGIRPRALGLDGEPKDPGLSLDEFHKRGAIRPMTVRFVAWWLVQTLLGRRPRGEMARLPAAVRSLAARSAHVSVVAALQKTRDAPFAIPLQGMYADANVQSAEIRGRYAAAPETG